MSAFLMLLAAAGCWLLVHERRLRRAAQAECDRALSAEAASRRALGLCASDLRSQALALLGHAGEGAGAGIGAATARILALADDLADHAAPAGNRCLRREAVALEPALREAIECVSAGLDPGRRHWRVGDDLAGLTLDADRRALGQILARVLANAARGSRHDDWVDITARAADGRVTLCVADEGAGLPADDAGGSRGLGLGLTLARRLAEAHGGALTIEAAPRVGSRVTISLPQQLAA